MPKASDHISSTVNKRILLGDSGTGKTTALWSLVAHDFKLRIYNYDNLLEPLITKVRMECPEKLDNIEFMTFRDKMKTTEMGPIVDGSPQAFIQGMKALDRWEDGTKPSEWGPGHICVIDSFTTKARAAWWWARGLQGGSGIAEGVPMKGFNPQLSFHTAQQALMNGIAMLTSESFHTNVLVICHIKYMERDGVTKGYPLSLGNAISPEIPSYFPCVTLATRGNNSRVLRTRSTSMIDLKDPRAFDEKFASELPMDELWKLF